MFAVIETGGKQYKVAKDSVFDIEKIEAEKNSIIEFDKVLLISDGDALKIGQPYVEGAKVTALVLDQKKDVKAVIFKFKPKTGYRRKTGHRQLLTTIKIAEITN